MDSSTWLCPECGEELEASFRFCWKCGTRPGGHPPVPIRDETDPAQPVPAGHARLSAGHAAMIFLGCAVLLGFATWRNSSRLFSALCLIGMGYAFLHIIAWIISRQADFLRERHRPRSNSPRGQDD